MPEIKTRETVKDIKILDKAAVAGERMKHAFVRSKDTAQNLMDDGQVSPSEYAEDKIKYAAEDVTYDTGHAIKKETDKAVDKGREAFREHRREKRLERQEKKVDETVRRYEQRTEHNVSQTTRQTRSSVRAKDTTIKTAQHTEHIVKQTAKSTGKATIKTADASIKSTQKAIKTAEKTSKAAIKTAETTAKATRKAAETAAKTAQKAAVAAKQAAIAAYKAAVVVGKAIVAAVKAIIAAIKELVAAIAAGGWVAVVVIIVICLIALIVGSCFGIFFSSEDNKTFSQHHGKDIVSTPKTESSVRKVSIPDFLCDELKEYLALLYNNDPDERIFKCTKSTLTKHFRNYTELAGLKPITIHGLRHSHVSLLISKRYDIFEVSKRIGHKSVIEKTSI